MVWYHFEGNWPTGSSWWKVRAAWRCKNQGVQQPIHQILKKRMPLGFSVTALITTGQFKSADQWEPAFPGKLTTFRGRGKEDFQTTKKKRHKPQTQNKKVLLTETGYFGIAPFPHQKLGISSRSHHIGHHLYVWLLRCWPLFRKTKKKRQCTVQWNHRSPDFCVFLCCAAQVAPS